MQWLALEIRHPQNCWQKKWWPEPLRSHNCPLWRNNQTTDRLRRICPEAVPPLCSGILQSESATTPLLLLPGNPPSTTHGMTGPPYAARQGMWSLVPSSGAAGFLEFQKCFPVDDWSPEQNYKRSRCFSGSHLEDLLLYSLKNPMDAEWLLSVLECPTTAEGIEVLALSKICPYLVHAMMWSM